MAQSQRRWAYFQFPPDTFHNQQNHIPYGMIVCRDDDNTLYFFSNTVAWCLGYSNPHQAIQNLPVECHSLKWASGLFLKKKNVEKLAHQTDVRYAAAFLKWFYPYYDKCTKRFLARHN
ncbi:uncharacterized protein TNCV_4416931 [Trichonephila clavipes]|uniref:Uncharacterized protein n=1 Tax=Trichonephila clavipes TaxID=2585209 RepID=A0A8X6VFZ1_TRICX|nr:uncharacterized protein TNCV_4570621 [Trichonephila clavipes]GFS82726.1 uncharacterized protein TNCV_443781 [Trichonephila clavipes]GFY04610.1 uncharacterized protein TNCV_4416931 [Trichonephila clavipes]